MSLDIFDTTRHGTGKLDTYQPIRVRATLQTNT